MAKKVSNNIPKCGKRLGSGAYKTAYDLGNKKVALVPHNQMEGFLETDYNRLKDLESMGLPTIKSKMGKVKHQGKVKKAIIVPKYDEGGVRLYWLDDATKAHHKQLLAIYRGMKKKGVNCSDLQFCIRRGTNPEIVLSDPGSVTIQKNPDHNYNLYEFVSYFNRVNFKFKR